MLNISIQVNPALPELRAELGRFTQGVMQSFLTDARRLTPVRSGQARRGWQIVGRGLQTQVVNRVPYISRLDNGYSRQAPNGIVKPAINQTARRY